MILEQLHVVQENLEKNITHNKELKSNNEALIEQLDTHAKERDQILHERDVLIKERDQLKKTIGDRSARIAELEAQIAEQADRQRLIDEEMAKAAGQLEMLKEIFRHPMA